MTVDASAVARVLGIDTQFKDLRGGSVLFLPQRIAVFAQGSSDVTYPPTKFEATSAGAAGARFGYGSPIHLILRELRPVNGDGVGTIPVTVYPLVDGVSSAAASGKIVPSGTQTLASAYRIRISGYKSAEFVVPVGAVSLNSLLRAMGNALNAVLEMPMKVGYTYGSVTAGALVGTGNGTLTALSIASGGTPKPGSWTLVCNTAVANGGVWTLTDPDGVVISTTVTQTVGAGAATVLTVGGLQFTITDGSTDFGVGASFTITVPATELLLVSKWKGLSANDLVVEVLGESLGTTFTVTQPTGGLVNPTVTSALNAVGNVWETLGLNAQNIEDTTTLDAFQEWGEGRWGQLVRKPLVVFTGNTESVLATATAISSVRRTDRINAQLVAPGSVNLPFVVAARQLAQIAVEANNNPPTDYGSHRATGLLPGLESVQWDWVARDAAIKAGSSTIEVKDGVINLSDIVTFWRPTGEEPPAYRCVVDIIKIQNVLFNLDLRFATKEWDGAPLIPDGQSTTNKKAKKAKMAIAVIKSVITGLADAAILSDPDSAKKTVRANISSQNPKRLDGSFTAQLGGNTNIVSLDFAWGFYFGTQAAA